MYARLFGSLNYLLMQHAISNMKICGYLKNRNISLNIRTIHDIINDKENNNSSALLAFIDFEKAFDNLNWTFLQKA